MTTSSPVDLSLPKNPKPKTSNGGPSYTPAANAQKSASIRRGAHVQQKKHSIELQQQLPSKLMANASETRKSSAGSAVASRPKNGTNAQSRSGQRQAALYSRRRGSEISPLVSEKSDATLLETSKDSLALPPHEIVMHQPVIRSPSAGTATAAADSSQKFFSQKQDEKRISSRSSASGPKSSNHVVSRKMVETDEDREKLVPLEGKVSHNGKQQQEVYMLWALLTPRAFSSTSKEPPSSCLLLIKLLL